MLSRIKEFFGHWGWVVWLFLISTSFITRLDVFYSQLAIIAALLCIWLGVGTMALYSFSKIPWFAKLFDDGDAMEQISKAVVVASIYIGAAEVIGKVWELVKWNQF